VSPPSRRRGRAPGRLLAALLLATAGACAACAACSADPAPAAADATGDAGDAGDAQADADATRSTYRIKITTEFEGQAYDFERDITGNAQAYAFGSTHIAPAVSFAVTETLYHPATLIITFSFGIVKESDSFPLQCGEAGTYPFDADPPEVDISVVGLRYRSTTPGAAGSLTVTQWSRTPGGVMAGTFQGRLLQATDKPDKRWADVEGEFHFIVPEPAQGQ
jgi:hypothetical protein